MGIRAGLGQRLRRKPSFPLIDPAARMMTWGMKPVRYQDAGGNRDLPAVLSSVPFSRGYDEAHVMNFFGGSCRIADNRQNSFKP